MLGLAERDGWLYVVQRCDVSRIKDTDGDGVSDLFEIVNDEVESPRLPRIRLRIEVRQERRSVAVPLSDLVVQQARPNTVAGASGSVPMQDGPDNQRDSFPRRNRLRPDGDVFYTDNQGPWNGPVS